MPNEIKALFTTGQFNITGLNGLATSPNYYTGYMSDLYDNRTTRFTTVNTYVRLNQGTSPTANKNAFVFLIKGDEQGHVTDGGSFPPANNTGPSGQGRIIMYNAPLLGTIGNSHVATTDESVYGEFQIDNPGPYFGIAISHDFGSSLDTTGNYVRFTAQNLEVQ